MEIQERIGSSRLRLGQSEAAEEALKTALDAFGRRLRMGADDPFTRYYAACASRAPRPARRRPRPPREGDAERVRPSPPRGQRSSPTSHRSAARRALPGARRPAAHLESAGRVDGRPGALWIRHLVAPEKQAAKLAHGPRDHDRHRGRHLRRGDRQGGAGARRAAAREPGRQLRLDRGGRARRERRAHRAARDQDARLRRRGRDPEPDPADQERLAERRRLGPGHLREPELVHDLPRRLARVLRHQALVRRPGRRLHPGRRRPRRRRLRHRPHGAHPALRRRGSDRQGDPPEEPAVQGRRDAQAEGALALRAGPGRHDHPALHDRPEEAQGSHVARRHPLLGRLAGRREARRAADRRRSCASAITCAPRRRTTSTSATRRTSSRRSSRRAARSPSCSSRSRRSRSSSEASGS